MAWRDWWPCLLTALITEERQAKERYLLAGGESNKWKAVFDIDDSEMSPEDIAKAITSFAGQTDKLSGAAGNMDILFETGRAEMVEVIIDEQGNYFDLQGNRLDVEKLGYFVPEKT